MMLNRVNFLLMIIVLLAVGGISYQMYISQNNNTMAIQAISAELAEMKLLAKDGRSNYKITIFGSVNAAGIYMIPPDKQLTLGDMLVKARGPSDRAVQINLYREIDGKRQTIAQETISLASEIGRLTQLLAPNDRIEVKPVLAYLPIDNSRSMGMVYVDGQIRRPGVYGLMPGRNMTVSKMLAAAGGIVDSPVVVKVWRTDEKGKNIVVSQTINNISEITKKNILLLPDDQVILSPVDSL